MEITYKTELKKSILNRLGTFEKFYGNFFCLNRNYLIIKRIIILGHPLFALAERGLGG
jgi:hypothetical protein